MIRKQTTARAKRNPNTRCRSQRKNQPPTIRATERVTTIDRGIRYRSPTSAVALARRHKVSESRRYDCDWPNGISGERPRVGSCIKRAVARIERQFAAGKQSRAVESRAPSGIATAVSFALTARGTRALRTQHHQRERQRGETSDSATWVLRVFQTF